MNSCLSGDTDGRFLFQRLHEFATALLGDCDLILDRPNPLDVTRILHIDLSSNDDKCEAAANNFFCDLVGTRLARHQWNPVVGVNDFQNL